MEQNAIIEEQIVFIHGTTRAKVIKIAKNAVTVEYLESSKRVKQGEQRTVECEQVRDHRQLFNNRNNLVSH